MSAINPIQGPSAASAYQPMAPAAPVTSDAATVIAQLRARVADLALLEASLTVPESYVGVVSEAVATELERTQADNRRLRGELDCLVERLAHYHAELNRLSGELAQARRGC